MSIPISLETVNLWAQPRLLAHQPADSDKRERAPLFALPVEDDQGEYLVAFAG